MPIEKPLPLMVGNKAYYSLTSYDPVKVTVDVPYTTEEDVELGLAAALEQMGGTQEDLDDPEWVAEHFDGLTSREQVMESARQQVVAMNTQIAEQQKLGKCVEALAERLGQSIPPAHLAQARQAVQMRFAQELQAEGMTPNQFMQRTHTTPEQLEAMFDRQAKQAAEGDAALSAYAHERKLSVDEIEYARLLGLSPEEMQKVIGQARSAGQSDELREAALRAKAAQIVVAECSCTYNHETPEQAHLRAAQYRQMQQMLAEEDDAQDEEDAGTEGSTGFKLV